jgi:peptidoglycan/LPS O-acetylase OafA/YrhL
VKYRPEIDGLRALAVLPVILFHGDIPGFDGGFVGVDVFFVISGFLITGILAEDLAQGRFNLMAFYERRARRILPALFVVVIACIPFAWAWFVPRDLMEFARSIVSTLTFWSNILFWRESGYFSTAAELKPLLHTWSLSVEEQFYIFFPLLLWGIWHLGRRAILVVLSTLLLVSLVLAEWGATHMPNAAFYLLPTRAWELLIGAIAALVARQGWIRFPRRIEEILGITGILLIAYAVTTFDETTPFPGVPALVPTLGALFILFPTSSPTFAHRLLSFPVMVGVGLVSYSAYLWHQPIFAFTRYRSFGEVSDILMLSLTLVSFGLAYLSWRFVETPFRNRARVSSKAVFKSSAALGAILCGIGALGWGYNGFPSRLNMPDSIEASIARSDRQAECFDRAGLHDIEDWTCILGNPDNNPHFLVFGDSHVLSLLDTLDTVAQQTGISGEFSGASGCTPFLSIHALRSDQQNKNCHAANLRLLQYAKDLQVKHVILVSRWTYYTDGGYTGKGISHIARSPDGPRDRKESRAAFEHGLAATVQAYSDAGIGLTLIAQVPQQVIDPMLAYGRAYLSDPDNTILKLSVTLEQHRKLQSFVETVFDRYNAPILDFTNILCSGDICPFGTTEMSYYFDDDHLSLAGADILLPALTRLIENIGTVDGT